MSHPHLEESLPTPFESAQLNLKLFELRREPVLREARAWFTRDFNPDSLEDVMQTLQSDRNPSFRMVLGYWDMAASLVTTGAIDPESFRAAHGEIFATFSKIHPFLAEFRAARAQPALFSHLESVVMAAPDAPATLERLRNGLRAAAKARAAKTAESAR